MLNEGAVILDRLWTTEGMLRGAQLGDAHRGGSSGFHWERTQLSKGLITVTVNNLLPI